MSQYIYRVRCGCSRRFLDYFQLIFATRPRLSSTKLGACIYHYYAGIFAINRDAVCKRAPAVQRQRCKSPEKKKVGNRRARQTSLGLYDKGYKPRDFSFSSRSFGEAIKYYPAFLF